MSEEIYKQHIIDHFNNPRNKAEMLDPDIEQVAKNPSCGDNYILYLRIAGGVINDATFSGVGCAISTAAGSLLTEKLITMNIEDAKQITKQDIFDMLKIEISIGREKCALLLFNALVSAFENYE